MVTLAAPRTLGSLLTRSGHFVGVNMVPGFARRTVSVRHAKASSASIDPFDGQSPFTDFDGHVPADLKAGVA